MKKSKFDLSRRGLLAALLACSVMVPPADATPSGGRARLAKNGTQNITPINLLTPGPGWDGTAFSGGLQTPTPTTIDSAPLTAICTELFQNWDTLVGNVTIGFDATAGGAVATGLSKVTFFCNGNSKDVFSETWNTYPDPNGKVCSDYGWHVTIDAPSSYARGVALGVPRPQISIWGLAYPNDPALGTRVIGPFVLNPRPARFDGAVTMGVPGGTGTVSDFKGAAKYRSDNGIERLNVICVDQGDYAMNTATTGAVADITTIGVYGITITAAQTASFLGSISGNVLTVSSVISGTIQLGNTLINGALLPNVVITNQTGGPTGGAGTYTLGVLSIDDALPAGGYTIAGGTPFATQVTAVMGNYGVATWSPAFDGIRLEGAGVHLDICKIGKSVAFAINLSTNSYGAFTMCGCESFMGVPTAANSTGSGSATIINGSVPGGAWTSPTILSLKSSANNGTTDTVPGGTVETYLSWFSFISCYHHDSFTGYSAVRLAKQIQSARLPQPILNAYRTAHNILCLDTSAIAAGLRTFETCYTLTNTGANAASAVLDMGAGNNGSGGTATLSTSGGTFTFVYSTSTSLQTFHDSITSGVGWVGGIPSSDGWTVTSNIDTRGLALARLCYSLDGGATDAIAPSAKIVSKSVPVGTGLLLGTIIDVHGDILVQTIPASLKLNNTDNRSARFVVALRTVEAAPILLGGNGAAVSTAQNLSFRNCVWHDSTTALLGPGLTTPTAIGNLAQHVVMVDNTFVDIGGSMSLKSLGMDPTSQIERNFYATFGWSVGSSVFQATFDGSDTMTVIDVSHGPSGGYATPYPTLIVAVVYPGQVLSNVAGSPTILSQLAPTPDGNGNTVPFHTGTYKLSAAVAATTQFVNVSSIKNITIKDNVYQTGSIMANDGGASKALGGTSDALCFRDPSNYNFSPNDDTGVSSPLYMPSISKWAGALNPDGSWKL